MLLFQLQQSHVPPVLPGEVCIACTASGKALSDHLPLPRCCLGAGCGNAFCGAFLAALAAGEEIQVAGAWGCVAGSLMAEHRGVPQLPPAAVHGEAKGRVEALLLKVQRLGD